MPMIGGEIGRVLGGAGGTALGGLIGQGNLGGQIGSILGGAAGRLLPFKKGGRVPGKKGKPVKAILHAGEYVLPVGVAPTKAQMMKVAKGKRVKGKK